MTLDDFEGANTKRDRKENGVWKSKNVFYKQPFGTHFRYMHQVNYQNNRWHVPISIETTWETKFCAEQNFSWYLVVSTVNANIDHGHFKKGVEMNPTLKFWR